MMRSLYSGVSGLRNHQTRMDVIGNNIANVNTAGYKTSRVIFQDIFSQLASGGTASNPDFGLGGTNSKQIGLGIKLSSIDVMHTAAAFQRSDNPFDMMIGGDGFFIVEGPDGYFYTRAGNFKTDDQGYLVNSDGYFVMGFPAGVFAYTGNEIYIKYEPNPILYDPSDPGYVGGTYDFTLKPGDAGYIDHEIGVSYTPPKFELAIDVIRDTMYDPKSPIQFSDRLDRIQLRAYHEDYVIGDPVDEDGMFVDGGGNLMKAWEDLVGFSVGNNGEISIMANNRKLTIGKIALAMFMNPGGLEKAGNSLYRETNASGAVQVTLPYENGAGSVEGGGLEMSNVDLAAEFTDMIVTQRGFQANSRVITVSDTLLEELINLKR